MFELIIGFFVVVFVIDVLSKTISGSSKSAKKVADKIDETVLKSDEWRSQKIKEISGEPDNNEAPTESQSVFKLVENAAKVMHAAAEDFNRSVAKKHNAQNPADKWGEHVLKNLTFNDDDDLFDMSTEKGSVCREAQLDQASHFASGQDCVNKDTSPILTSRTAQSVSFDRKAIKCIANERNIDRLVHFTRAVNLENILTHGIYSVAQGRNYMNYISDKDRFDAHLEYISTSVSFPNYKMLMNKRGATGDDWVVIELDPAILWELECAYYATNAANAIYKNVAIEDRSGSEAFASMFVQKSSSTPSWTFDPQAEVMVKDHIPTSYIKGIVFHQIDDFRKFSLVKDRGMKCTIERHDRYFRPRADYVIWNEGKFYNEFTGRVEVNQHG